MTSLLDGAGPCRRGAELPLNPEIPAGASPIRGRLRFEPFRYSAPMKLLDKMLSPLLKRGELTIIGPDGSSHSYGKPDPELRPVTVRVTDNRAALRIVRDPALGTVEAWMDDKLQLVEGEIIDLILLIRRNSRWESAAGAASSRSIPAASAT
jgi:hypothetical protein